MQAFNEIATLVHKCQKKEEKEENILSVPPKMFKFQKAIKNYLYKEEFISPSWISLQPLSDKITRLNWNAPIWQLTHNKNSNCQQIPWKQSKKK